jgi:hypothetical protein
VFHQGSALLTSGIHSFAKLERGLQFLTGCLIALPILWITPPRQKFTRKKLIEIHDVFWEELWASFFPYYIFILFSMTF